MTIPTSGPISLLTIQGEFGGANPIGMNEYYRGGGLVDAGILAGGGSFQTAPMAPNGGPILIPASGAIQASHFYGTQSVIVGNSGIIPAPINNDTTSDFVDVTLPAGVDLIRFFLVGGGGGGGGNDSTILGGQGGGGSTLSGTINTSWAGPVNVPRILRFFIGRGGGGGLTNTVGNSWSNPTLPGGHGYGMFGIQATADWGAWMNQYAVTSNMVGGRLDANAVPTARSLYFPNTGTYTFQFQADNGVSIAVDGTVIADTSGNNDQASNSATSYLLASPLTRTISLSAGHHKVRFNHTNTSDSIGGYAVRIVNNSAGQFWTTRDDYSTTRAYPAGGSNGYSGNGGGGSGYGGSGGSGTMFSIITSYGEYFVALAGGGGGGGGAGVTGILPNVNQNANWCNQGWAVTAYPGIVAGGDGEYMPLGNNGTLAGFGTDGGGGGAGGGGMTNSRQYITITNKNWLYSGFGGRTCRGLYDTSDKLADGGESGKSAITAYATQYADVMHVPATSRFPINPTNPTGLPAGTLATLNSYGHGGDSTIAGTNGVAYVDWGVVNASVPAPAVTRAVLRAGIVPYNSMMPPQYSPGVGRGYWVATISGAKTFTLDAFGGGGNPGSEYSYSWANQVGAATIDTPTSYRTLITMPNVISSGTVRCTVSDGISTVTADYSWHVVQDDDPIIPSSCFPAGAMVLMADGTTQAIETVKAGDSVMSVQGPTKVVQMDTPILGTRKLLTFPDGHTWSEEHSHWTRDAAGAQWWWASNADMWRAEANAGLIGGLLDNNSMRTGAGFEYAHVDGWKNNVITEIPATYDMPLYLPVTSGAPIIVDGYLVGAGLNEPGFDYTTINWDVARTTLTPTVTRTSGTVQPIYVPGPEPFPVNWEPPPVEWVLPTAP